MNKQTQQTQTPDPVDGMTLDGRKQRRTTFPDGHWVSTVDLRGASAMVGVFDVLLEFLDPGRPAPRPNQHFETMTFGPDSLVDLECDRATTWEEALAHHAAQVQKLAQKLG